MPRLLRPGLIALFGGLLSSAALAGLAREPRGVVIESVGRGSTADRAGLQEGDLLLTWAAGPGRGGALGSPFDLQEVFLEQVPRRKVCLQGSRGAQARSWCVAARSPSGAFAEIELHPNLGEPLLALYRRGQNEISAGRLDAGLAPWRQAAREARAHGDGMAALWLEVQAARALGKAGRGPEADRIYRRSIRPLETRASPIAAKLLREWGNLFMERYLWEQARDCFLRALAVDRKVSRQNLAASWSLTGLGQVTSRSGDPTDPGRFFHAALGIREQLAPDSSDLAATLWDWGQDAVQRKDWKTAAARFQEAMTIQERATPESLYVARRLSTLGAVTYLLGERDTAERLWQRALAIGWKEGASGDLGMEGVLQGLASIAGDRNDLETAEIYLLRAIAIGNRLAPDELSHEDVLHDLGLLERRQGKNERAARYLCQAVASIERKRRAFANIQEVRMRWSAAFTVEYSDCAEALAAVGRTAEALEVAESGRARAFLDQLAERSFQFSQLPARKAARWRRLNREYDGSERELARLRSRPQPETALERALEGKQLSIRREKARMQREYLSLDPSCYPEPLEFGGIERTLDPGTTLLFFSVGQTRTLLFVVRPDLKRMDSPAVLRITAGASDLKKTVQEFRTAILERRFDLPELRKKGADLYQLLLGSAGPLLAGARRLLIVPDGPLHLLPFAALVRDGHYLIEWQPIHFAASISAYQQLIARRRSPGRPFRLQLLAFGDPLYPPPDPQALPTAEPDLRSGLMNELPPLPAARQELAALAGLFPRSRVFLGPAATEERAKRLAPTARWLHFAVHGLLDERSPLDSALALSPPRRRRPGEDNGLLQAWEVTESMRFDAELVTLSACDTAVGREIGGEGLLSLTRAFQYAGAHSVLATLWGISDHSTEPLIERFYQRLREGASEAQALREAQMEQLRKSRDVSPFSWAAFQLYGDWK